MITFTFYGFIWLIMISYFYIVNKFKISDSLLSCSIKTLYYIYYKASYKKNLKNKGIVIKNGIKPVFDTLKINLRVHGFTDNSIPTLYVSNHCSYLDSLIIKYIKPDIKTIAKSDTVKDFSIMKNFAKTILDNWGVIFYERGNKKSGKKVRKLIRKNIKLGDSILVYPEGGSFVFNNLQKFYKGSFEVAYNNNIIIQPITIKYHTDIAWGGKKSKFTKKRHLDIIENTIYCQKQETNPVDVTFHPVVIPKYFENAKHVMNYCKYIITDEWLHGHHYKYLK